MNYKMNRVARFSLLLAVILPLTFFCSASLAQSGDKGGDSGPSREEVLNDKIADLRKRIESFGNSEKEDVAAALNVTLEQLRERTEILRDTLSYYNQELQAISKHQSLLKGKQVMEERIASGEALQLEESPPYSLEFYDDFNVSLSESKRQLDTTQLSISVAERAVSDAKERLKEAGAGFRQLKSETGAEKDRQEVLRRQFLLERAGREAELAEALVGYHKQSLANARLEAELAAIRVNLHGRINERIRGNLHFDPEDLEEQLAAIDEGRKELQERESLISRNLRQANRELDRARGKAAKVEENGQIAKTVARLSAAEQWRETYRVQLGQVENMLQQMSIRKELWKQRYELIKGGVNRAAHAELKKEADKRQDRFRQRLSLEQERQTNLQLQIGKLEEQLEQEGLTRGAKGSLNEKREALVELVGSTINFISALNRTSQMNQRFIDELERAGQSLTFNEIIEGSAARIKSWWQTELLVVDERALTVGKVITALGILLFGILLTRLLSRLVQKKLLIRLDISTSSAAIAGKLIHYTVLLLIVLIVLKTVNIPLTAFTFLGGAIAIGVGFGAQKLINNFISSFIIMAEQPIRVGDLILMDNESGWIEDIGARCTTVRTFANIHILVPNSYFLENNIINWTHHDNIVRGCITIGVAYGSPTREVKELLLKAAEEHGEVRQDPAPHVWFADFGDNALVFEFYFWVMVTDKTGVKMISSDLRFMIENSFREAGITIAFPQRDLHFDSDHPLRIELSRSRVGREKNK